MIPRGPIVLLIASALGIGSACSFESTRPGVATAADDTAAGMATATTPDVTSAGREVSSGTRTAGSGDAILDVGGGMPGVCVECSMVIDSRQSGELSVQSDDVFAIGQLDEHVVYAMGTYGSGRFIATADSSLPLQEQTDCPVLAWLAGSHEPEPSMLLFGWAHPFELGERTFPPMVHLPPEYVGDPERLAADYDVVLYFEESQFLDEGDEPSDEELQTLLDFAGGGGGLVVSSEYSEPGGGYLTPEDIDSVNRILQGLGIEALAVSHSWGEVGESIEFPCFPPVG